MISLTWGAYKGNRARLRGVMSGRPTQKPAANGLGDGRFRPKHQVIAIMTLLWPVPIELHFSLDKRKLRSTSRPSRSRSGSRRHFRAHGTFCVLSRFSTRAGLHRTSGPVPAALDFADRALPKWRAGEWLALQALIFPPTSAWSSRFNTSTASAAR